MFPAVLLVFAAVFASVVACFLAVMKARQSPVKRVKSRLRRMELGDVPSSPEAAAEGLIRKPSRVEAFFFELPVLRQVKFTVERSGLQISPMTFILYAAAGAIGCALLLFAIRGSVVIAVLAGFFAAELAMLIVKSLKKKRETRFMEQLPDALTMISRSLRAGHSLTGAVELLSEELPEPSADIFKIAYEQQKFGMRMADALATLPEKIESVDLQFFVTIIRISSETGGNLAEILDKLAETIRSRLQIRQQVQVLTAEGRVSGYVLIAMPVVIFVVFYLMRPDYMSLFFTERKCQIPLLLAGIAQIIGLLMIRKIVNIRI